MLQSLFIFLANSLNNIMLVFNGMLHLKVGLFLIHKQAE